MIRIATSHLRPGMIVGYPLVRDDGVVLLKEGVRLNDRLIRKIRELGFEYIYVRDPGFADVDLEEILSHDIRRQALVTLNESFYQIVRGKEAAVEPLKRLVDEIIDEVLSTKKSVVSLIQLRQHDDAVFSHSVNVAALSVFIGKFLRLSRQQLRVLALGSLMHDLGKIRVPLEVLNKPGSLSEEEWHIIRKHSCWSAELMSEWVSEEGESIHIALQHHERLDGSGYPYGLSGEEIHFLSRICACADVYDALTVDRPYRKRFSYAEALEYLMGNASRLFDLQVVTTMVRHIAPYPVGETVRLTTGEIAVVVRLNEGLPIRPVVRVIRDPNGQPLEKPRDLDLMKELTVAIVGTAEVTWEVPQKKSFVFFGGGTGHDSGSGE
ncbi:HD domain-containing phosphohydrolase [Candidatus Caldatribacterium saccharofermentans]|uniref:HD-GYP domain-containing protein n=1 Tax=Candidatus Caldatribacterium saccharofermentans TaxID=1454753 RepID=A0A7V4WKD6_9BACT